MLLGGRGVGHRFRIQNLAEVRRSEQQKALSGRIAPIVASFNGASHLVVRILSEEIMSRRKSREGKDTNIFRFSLLFHYFLKLDY